jgi:hypothetical protein
LLDRIEAGKDLLVYPGRFIRPGHYRSLLPEVFHVVSPIGTSCSVFTRLPFSIQPPLTKGKANERPPARIYRIFPTHTKNPEGTGMKPLSLRIAGFPVE